MSSKARFSSQQQPVKVVQADGMAYVFICLNEQRGTESYPDMGDGRSQETYYEYDYNEIVRPETEIPVADIQAHPEDYLDYQYNPQPTDPGIQTLTEIQELRAAIERGLTT